MAFHQSIPQLTVGYSLPGWSDREDLAWLSRGLLILYLGIKDAKCTLGNLAAHQEQGHSIVISS